jgi:putative Holliday junction resolvase
MQIVDTPAALISGLAPNTRLMGVDLGSKTIGLALGDSHHKIATPFFTIRRKKFGPDAAALAEIVADEKVGAMVMGLPLNMDGSAGPRVQATQAFLRNLTNLDNFPDLPVLLWDERLSTAAVERTLLEADTSRAKRADVIDKMAAAYILQGAIDALYGV